MIICVIGFAGILLDDETFGAARSARDLPINVILVIATARQPSFAIFKVSSSDITGKWFSVPFLYFCQQVIRFLRRRSFDRFP